MKTQSNTRRRGTMLPILAMSATGIFGVLAFAIDLGVVAISRTNCQNAADAGSLAGARMLNNKTGVTENDKDLAITTAKTAVKLNNYLRTQFDDTTMPNTSSVQVGIYDYDATNARFTASFPGTLPTGKSWTAMQVSLTTSNPTFFARVLGVTAMPAQAVATAVHRPRDVAFVIDLSGSMGFGSYHHWPYDLNEGTDIQGFMNPDPNYPKFGHYARYTYYDNTNTDATTVTSATPSARANPLQNFNFATNEVGPNNITMESRGGPPIVEDFYEAVGNPTTINNSTTWKNAFKRWSPTQTAGANPVTLTPPTFDYTGYDVTTAATPAPENFADQSDSPITYAGDKWPRTDGSRGAGSASWSSLSGTTFTDTGAKTLKEFLNYSLTAAAGRDLSTINKPSSGGVATPLTNSGKDGSTADASYLDAVWERYGYDMDVINFRGLSSSPKTVSLVASGVRFKGYSMGPRYWGKTFFIWPPDPRYGNDTDAGGGTPDPTNLSTTSTVQDSSGKWICDWRRRFFLRGDGAAFNPQTDNINNILFSTTAGHVFNAVTTTVGGGGAANTPGYYRINYTAIMKWLKTGAVTLPQNMRAGRILYYSSMPDDVSESGTGDAQDKRFWRQYIHFVLGIAQYDSTNYPVTNWTYAANRMLAGVEANFPFGTLSNTTTTAFTPTATPISTSTRSSSTATITTTVAHGLTTGASVTIAGNSVSAYNGTFTILSVPSATTFTFTLASGASGSGGTVTAVNRKPYMCYTDNINRPRAHLWFGGMTMTMFIERCQLSRQWYAGTVHEAQCWQLKSAMTSAINDIKSNHPNDWVGMSYFSNKTVWMKPIVPMGQDYFSMKNSLYFPKATVAALKASASATTEDRPYTSTLGDNSTNIPNGNGGTDPNSGLAIAYNLLSTSTSLSSTDYGTYARKGAAKVVIFETDGVPNTTNNWTITGTGSNTYYQNSGTPESWAGDSSLNSAGQAGVAVASRITASVSTSGVSGYSTTTTPARVHTIGFGDVFSDYNGSNYSSCNSTCQDALRFLLRVEQVGNTSPAGAPGTVMIPYNNVITGAYQRPYPNLPINASTNPMGRIEKLRTCMESIMQSGIQVVLIQ